MPAHRASFTFHLPDPPSARAVAAALALEIADGPEGVIATLTAADDGTVIQAELEADSVSGLRAATNSVLRLLDAAMRTL